jgi:hypothetical protein
MLGQLDREVIGGARKRLCDTSKSKIKFIAGPFMAMTLWMADYRITNASKR